MNFGSCPTDLHSVTLPWFVSWLLWNFQIRTLPKFVQDVHVQIYWNHYWNIIVFVCWDGKLKKNLKDVFRLNTTVTTFWPFFTKKRIFNIWSNYNDSNMSLKYVFHEKNVFRSEKTLFLAKSMISYHKSLLYQMIMRIYWKDIWLK